jgi:hypothetical protein
MANSFPSSGLAYADAFSVGTANAAASTLYVASSCVQAVRIEHNYNQSNLHHNTLWLRATNSGPNLGASIGFTVVNSGGDHHRANIEATANANQVGGNLALYTRNNNGNDTLGLYINHTGNVGINTTSPETKLQVNDTANFGNTTFNARSDGGYLIFQEAGNTRAYIQWGLTIGGSAGGCSLLITNSEPGGNLALQTATSAGVANVCALVVANTGNIGIGTNTPNRRLTISRPTESTSPQIELRNVGGISDGNFDGISFTQGASGEVPLGSIRLKNASNGYPGLGFYTRNDSTNESEKFTLTNSGNVGVGTTSPRYSLDVAGGMMSNFYMSCCSAALDGVGPYDYGIIGSGNGAGALLINDIVGARYSVHAGSYNLTFRKSVRNTVGACVYCTVMQFVGTTDTNCVVNVNIENRLGVGTASPSYRLHVNGTFYAAGSSVDYKQGICQYNTDSCMFMKLKPVTYQYKDEYTHLGKELKSETQIGLIAEDVAEVYPELAILVNEDDNKIVRNVDYEKLSIVLLSEVQKLRKELDELKTK